MKMFMLAMALMAIYPLLRIAILLIKSSDES